MCSEYSLVKAHFKYGKYGNVWKFMVPSVLCYEDKVLEKLQTI